MALNSKSYFCYIILAWSLNLIESSRAHLGLENRIKTQVFLSPKVTLQPGLVSNKVYNIDFPRGHIALKSFKAELVNEEGEPIPLHETYLHHWVVYRYYQRKGSSNRIPVKNSGVCDDGLTQYFGIGSETRRTATHIPDPYGIEVGNVPEGYEETWLLNVHAIDTRGAEDVMGCTECRCNLYNVTEDEHGDALPGDYQGGLRCCYDDARCKLKPGLERDLGRRSRNLYLRYTVKYVDWSESIVPVNIYILDVTEVWTKAAGGSRGINHCPVEYDVESCPDGEGDDRCIDTRTLAATFSINGDVIYGVGHQHAGAMGTALYGQDGREICASYPIYGKGHEAGNESGYVVGMTTCYPWPGSVKISSGEMLTLVSNYSSATKHIGVMGFVYLLVAEPSAYPTSSPLQRLSSQVYDITTKVNVNWAVAMFGLVVLVFFVFQRKGGDRRPGGYEPVV